MGTIADVEAVLNPVLSRYGFAAGQDGGNGADDSGDVIWCAPFDRVRESAPWLPQVTTQFDPNRHLCFDIRISLTLGNLAEVDLEGLDLTETLRMCDSMVDAAAVESTLETPVETAGLTLAAVLTRLFEGSSGAARPSTDRQH